jgi:hypothetical protein
MSAERERELLDGLGVETTRRHCSVTDFSLQGGE